MWNVTYPRHRNPLRFRAVAVIVLVQQIVGLVGESCCAWDFPLVAKPRASIERFLLFDERARAMAAASDGCCDEDGFCQDLNALC